MLHKILLSIAFLVGITVSGIAQEARLARIYFANQEYEKAATLYKKLYDKNHTNDYYFERYFVTLIELEDYKEAEKVVKKAIKASPEKVQRYVDYGSLFERQSKMDKANEQYEKAIKLLPGNQAQILKLAKAFASRKQYDYAIATYEKGSKLMKIKNMFAYELGSIYSLKGDIPKMIGSYLDCLDLQPSRMTNIQAFFQRTLPKSEGGYAELKKQLYERIQKEPNNTVYAEMLIWVFMQEGNFERALQQAKALDKRLSENGTRIYRLAQTAIREKDYETGIDGFEYLIKKGINCPYYIDAKQRVLAAKRDQLVEGYEYTKEDLVELEAEYEDFLNEFGRSRNTSPIMRELADFEAFYLNNIDKAISILEEVIKIPSLPRLSVAQAKIDLGDYYLMKSEVWESTLLYSQVDKEMKDAPLGELARFKNAKLSYYKGDFEWAQDQLDVLKGSTSELISNDAIDLSVFIMEHFSLDTTATPMKMFAKADLYTFQNKFEESFKVMDSITTKYKGHGLEDDILYNQSEIYIKKYQYNDAIDALEDIVEKHKKGIWVDNALFKMGELYETRLNDKTKAMEYYEKILIEHTGSLFTVEARKRYRKLRGDGVQ
ncbi:MAG: tetratricopeptide repeat protein [Aureispira sp.]|nr:tetratricopeptide repeat protein [Aureispira sp.]